MTDDNSSDAVQDAGGVTGAVQVPHEVPADVFPSRCCGDQNQQGSALLLLGPPGPLLGDEWIASLVLILRTAGRTDSEAQVPW